MRGRGEGRERKSEETLETEEKVRTAGKKSHEQKKIKTEDGKESDSKEEEWTRQREDKRKGKQ